MEWSKKNENRKQDFFGNIYEWNRYGRKYNSRFWKH